jgi:hypothetical protein
MASVVSPLPAEAHDEFPMALGWCLTPRQEDTVDILQAMLLQEKTKYPKPRGYCVSGSQESSLVDPLTNAWRRRICEWIFEIVDHFSFDREVVGIALNYIDRSASFIYESSPGKEITKNDFQLLAISSLYLAIKLHGESDTREQGWCRLKMRISSFEELSRGLFTKKTIEATEQNLFTMLDWQLNQPTPAQFLAHFVRLLPRRWPCTAGGEQALKDIACEVYDVAKYLTELACFDFPLAVQADPSTIAYGALLCALDDVVSRTPWSKGIYDVFLRNVARVDPLWTPFNSTVIMIKQKLKRFAAETLEESSSSDQPSRVVVDLANHTTTPQRVESEDEEEISPRESPSCVCDAPQISNSPKRKRPRTEYSNAAMDDPEQHIQPTLNPWPCGNEI